jgi:hypothetical protein
VRTTLGSLAIRLTIAVTVCGTTARAVAADSLLRPSNELTQLALPPANYPTTETPSLNEPISPSAATDPHDDVEYPEPRQPIALFDSSPIDADESYYDGDSLAVGQYPDNWLWGAGGSPYRTGPGWMDDWKVGCRWDVTVDGMLLFREDANLDKLFEDTSYTSAEFDQFEYAPGGRVYLSSEIPHRAGYRVQAGYEGVEEWNAVIVDSDDLRRGYYRSSFHSAELNFTRSMTPAWQPFCGVRYVKFDDEVKEIEFPPVPDQVNIFDLENNLIGFQIGARSLLLRPSGRCAVEGFVNGGIYSNEIKRTTLTATVYNVSEPSELATLAEASLTGIFRLNRCWALRAGYQVLWIDGLSLADDAFPPAAGDDTRDLLFHGLHAGIECRR